MLQCNRYKDEDMNSPAGSWWVVPALRWSGLSLTPLPSELGSPSQENHRSWGNYQKWWTNLLGMYHIDYCNYGLWSALTIRLISFWKIFPILFLNKCCHLSKMVIWSLRILLVVRWILIQGWIIADPSDREWTWNKILITKYYPNYTFHQTYDTPEMSRWDPPVQKLIYVNHYKLIL